MMPACDYILFLFIPLSSMISGSYTIKFVKYKNTVGRNFPLKCAVNGMENGYVGIQIDQNTGYCSVSSFQESESFQKKDTTVESFKDGMTLNENDTYWILPGSFGANAYLEVYFQIPNGPPWPEVCFYLQLPDHSLEDVHVGLSACVFADGTQVAVEYFTGEAYLVQSYFDTNYKEGETYTLTISNVGELIKVQFDSFGNAELSRYDVPEPFDRFAIIMFNNKPPIIRKIVFHNPSFEHEPDRYYT